ncbi:MAG: 3-deoxy-8-phosphooctulonate synthase, partial [Acetobacter orientalis]
MTQKARNIQLGALTVGNTQPFVLIAGPCQIESAAHALETASALKEICEKAEIGLIYKSSFDKANRTSLSSARGVGMHEGLSILADVRERLSLPVLTDVHAPEQCAPVAEAVDVLQIPAFLCRQTDLLLAAGRTGA